MRDGIYLIEDALGPAGDTKTLVTPAYNYRGTTLSAHDNWVPVGSEYWWDHMGQFNFVQDDDAFWISTHEYIKRFSFDVQECYNGGIGYACPKHYDTGCWIWPEYNVWCNYYESKWTGHDYAAYCNLYAMYQTWFKFPQRATDYGDAYKILADDAGAVFGFPDPTPDGDIVSVAVWAEVRGRVKIRLNSTYGDATSGSHMFAWESLAYNSDPAGGSWTWAKINALTAGVNLYHDYFGSGACRRLKVVITTTTTEITLWPNSDVAAYTSMPMIGNYLEDIELCDRIIDEVIDDYLYLRGPFLYTARVDSTYQNSYYTSDLSEIAPAFSEINSIKVTFGFVGSALDADNASYVRPFLEIGGTKYYGTAHGGIDNTFTYQEFDETWVTNPSTGEAWDYDTYKALKFGVHAWYDDDMDGSYLLLLYATTSYQERKIAPTYSPVPAKLICWRSEEQSNLAPDDMQFLSEVPIPERARIAYFKDGDIEFTGFVWSCQSAGGIYHVTAKGYQALLDYRFFPNLNVAPQLNSLSHKLTLDEILSADPPTKPLHYYIGETFSKDDNEGWAHDWVYTNVEKLWLSHESPIGMFWFINSWIPAGSGDSTGRIPHFGPMAAGRAVYGLDRMISQTLYEYNSYVGATGVQEYSYNESTGNGTYTTMPYLVYGVADNGGCVGNIGYKGYSPGYPPAGLRRLAKHTSSSCTDEQYYPDPDGGLVVKPWPGSQEILIDGAMDCFVDLDSNDAGDLYCNEVLTLSGTAKSTLIQIFELAGLEICAHPAIDGRLHLTAKYSNGRGSEAEPLFEFINGANCHIETSTATDPPIDVAAGHDVGVRAVLDLQQTDARFVKAVQTDRTGWDLDNYLNAFLDSDSQEWRITTGPDHSHLRPLDWISADGSTVRIRAIDRYPGETVITAGKSLINLSEKWGEWRHKLVTSDESNVISRLEFTSTAASISQAFTIKAKDYKRGDWTARLTLSWDLTVPDEDTVAEVTATPKAYVTIGGKVVHPGTVLLQGKSGSLTFDISDACSKSTTSNTSNTLIVYLVDSLTESASPTFYHTITGKIDQLRVAAVLTNA